MGDLGDVLGSDLGSDLGPSWDILGPLGGILGPLGDILVPFLILLELYFVIDFKWIHEEFSIRRTREKRF